MHILVDGSKVPERDSHTHGTQLLQRFQGVNCILPGCWSVVGLRDGQQVEGDVIQRLGGSPPSGPVVQRRPEATVYQRLQGCQLRRSQDRLLSAMHALLRLRPAVSSVRGLIQALGYASSMKKL